MDKKKIGLIIGIIVFVVGIIGISLIYNGNTISEEDLEAAEMVGIVRLNDANFTEETEDPDKVVVLDFYENMCPPCTSMVPTIINIAKSSGMVKVGMINTKDDEAKNITRRYEVSATPTIIILKDGRIVKKFVGATSEDTIMAVINAQLESKNEK